MTVVVAAALLAGLLGALTGIGGVILVPALTESLLTPVHVAIATTMFAFTISGPVAAYVTVRRAGLALVPVVALCAAAAVGALVGTVTLEWLPRNVVRLFVAASATWSGLQALVNPARLSTTSSLPTNLFLVALGLVVGWGSAVSGTGGPVLLIPILLTLGTPARTAVGLGLAAHVPIVAAATVVNLAAGRVEVVLGAVLGLLLVVGTLGGVWLSGRLPARHLTTTVALALVAVGLWYAYMTLEVL